MDVDVKILTKTLATRLRASLPTLVHEEQQGFIPGRSVHNHLRFFDDLRHLIFAKQDRGLALFLDFEKAYDRVNWDYMIAVLRFGDVFIRWVQILYSNPMYFLLLNGRLTRPLKPTRGVKQGDPLSPLLFLLTLEPLGNLLRAHPQRGLAVSSEVTTTGIYFADDSTILAPSVTALQAQLVEVQLFCAGSGARLNMSKCVLLNLCRGEPPPSLPGVRCLQPDESVRFLGLLVGSSTDTAAIINSLESKLFTRLRQWCHRARKVHGRLLLVQAVIISTLWHCTQHVVVPANTVTRWQRAINAFVLSRRTEPDDRPAQLVRSELLYLSRSEGGQSRFFAATTTPPATPTFLPSSSRLSINVLGPPRLDPLATSLW